MEGHPNDNHSNCQPYGEDGLWEPSDIPGTLTPVPYVNRFGGIRHGFNHPPTHSYLAWFLPAVNLPAGGVEQESYTSRSPLAAPDEDMQNSSTIHNDYNPFLPDETTAETEDWPMTTPAPSRKASEFVDKTYSRALHDRQPLGSCTHPHLDSAFPGSSPNPNGWESAEFNENRPFARLPINTLLNCAPPAPSTDSDHVPQDQDILHPSSPEFSPNSSYSSLTSSSSTITLQPSPTFEEIYFLISTLHQTCLSASTAYINHRSSSYRPKTRTGRYHPYRSPPPPPPQPAAPVSLMDNISTICTHLWRKARKDVMAPHRAEAETVRVMKDLYEWGEVIARGLERDTDEDGGDSGEMGMRVVEAARLFCKWLGDGRAVVECEETGEELRGLMEGNRGAGVKDGEDFEGFEDLIE